MNAQVIFNKLLGTSNFDSFSDTKDELLHTKIYILNLTKYIKGLPPIWKAVVVDDELKHFDFRETTNYIIEIIKFLDRVDPHIPVVVISPGNDIKLRDKLEGLKNPGIFLIDRVDLESKVPGKKNIPLIKAIREKQPIQQLAELFFPYSPKIPVSGWKFFGRKKEIETILTNSSNMLIVGARQIGKTSILKEVKELLIKRDESVWFVDLQFTESTEEVISRMVGAIDGKVLSMWQKQYSQRNRSPGSWLELALRRIIQKTQKDKIYILLDELENAITNTRRGDWSTFGVFRKLSHEGLIRIIATGWQELDLKQSDINSPFYNFARTVHLSVLNVAEVEEFLIDPLSLWVEIADKKELINFIEEKFGTHPLILQYLGYYLFQDIFLHKLSGNTDLLSIVKRISEDNKLIKLMFAEPAKEMFTEVESSVSKYLYLKFCKENDLRDLTRAVLDDDWVEKTLDEIGVNTEYSYRLRIYKEMEMRGLLKQYRNNFQYQISSPIIYKYIVITWEWVDRLIAIYKKEIQNSSAR